MIGPDAQRELAQLCTHLYARREDGVVIPYVEKQGAGWLPEHNWCHANVDRWIAENQGYKAVRGWLVFNLFFRMRFSAHSMVEEADGTLIDITPSNASRRYPFLRHENRRRIHAPRWRVSDPASGLRARNGRGYYLYGVTAGGGGSTMQIRRGMLRLWIVASVIWIGIIASIGYPEWRNISQPMKLYLLPDATSDFHVVDNVFAQFDANIQKAHLIIEYPHGITLMIHNSVPSDVAEPKKKEFERNYVAPLSREYEERRFDTAMSYLKIALLPPLDVFAFGAAMAWALTGFRRD